MKKTLKYTMRKTHSLKAYEFYAPFYKKTKEWISWTK